MFFAAQLLLRFDLICKITQLDMDQLTARFDLFAD